MTETERIDFLITHLAHGNANRFADRTGISKANVSKLKRGEIRIQKSISKILEAYPTVNREWLVTGDGYPGDITTSLVKERYEEKLRRADKVIDHLTRRIDELESKLEELK